MKMARKYKIEKCVNRDPTRENLSAPYFDPGKGLLVATDGHALVAVPVEPEEGEAAGYVDILSLQTERKRYARFNETPIKTDGDDRDRKFPDWKQVVPESRRGEDGTVTVGLNVKLLRNICDGLGCDGLVELEVQIDPKRPTFVSSPILVRAYEHGDSREIAVLMPLSCH